MRYLKIISVAPVLAAAFTFGLISTDLVAQENTGTFQPRLVGGTVVSQADQEQFGLLALSNPEGFCSASMLNDYWAITAAHCVYSQTTGAAFTPSQITLTANWPSNNKAVQPVQIVAYSNGTAASKDIALLQTGLYDFVRSELPGWPSSTTRTLQSTAPTTNSTVTCYGQGINQLAFQAGGVAYQSQRDGQYRSAAFGIYGIPQDGSTYTFSGQNGATVAGGDSGGPALIQEWDDPLSINRQWVSRLLGVHSRCSYTCLPGQTCTAPNTWQWVSSISSCTDAAVYPLQDSINQTIQQIPPPRQFIGTFSNTYPDKDPVFLYAVKEDGTLLWYHYDATKGGWQGPNPVGSGWQNFRSVIPAGGNNFYAIAKDGSLFWYQHEGFSDGSPSWQGPNHLVGGTWNDFVNVFSGGEGILYAIRSDGALLWYSNAGYWNGTWNWQRPKVVGSGWADFKDVFSMGQGVIYAVKKDGTLLWYKHNGYENGDVAWTGPYTIGSGWEQFTSIVPAGNGVILATRPDGTLFWYKHDNFLEGVSKVLYALLPRAIWEGGVQVGSGWNGFLQMFAFLPTPPEQPN